MLPQKDHSYAIIWCMQPELAQQTYKLADKHFLSGLQSLIGRRLGKLQASSQRFLFPLHLAMSKQIVKPRCILIGNAAHSLHPVAGQSFNLALREIAHLTGLLMQAKKNQQDLASRQLLRAYSDYCLKDQNRIARATHILIRCFNYDLPGIKLLRNKSMLLFDQCVPIKAWLTRQAIGGTHLPDLSLGIGDPDYG